ncbi:MAG: hypothetical protein R3F39_13580 [Myxococcota bacterium]
MNRRMGTVVAALGVLAILGEPARAAEPMPDVVEHRLPVDASGRLALRELLGVLLRETGSAVPARAGLDLGSLDLQRLRNPTMLLAANLGLASVGLGLRVEDDALVLRIDRERLRRRVDDLEGLLRTISGRGPPVHQLEHVDGSSRKGPPVVLIHGLDSSPERLRGAGRALGALGYDVYLYRYPDDAGIERSASALGDLLRELRALRGVKISLVTVSMGGLIARTWLELDPRYGDEVAGLIACVPPFRGSGIARYHVLTEINETVRDLIGSGFDGFFAFDGLGQGARDLVPGSRLLERLAASGPRPGVSYAILAGDKPIVDGSVFAAARQTLLALREHGETGRQFGLDLVGELVEEAAKVSGGRGDGAVTLDSQSMPGVSDRVVLPMSHFEALSGDGVDEPIPALAEVLARLPAL